MKIEKEREVRQFNSSNFCVGETSRALLVACYFLVVAPHEILKDFFWGIVNKKVIHINLQIKILICQQFENWISFKLKTLSNLSGY